MPPKGSKKKVKVTKLTEEEKTNSPSINNSTDDVTSNTSDTNSNSSNANDTSSVNNASDTSSPNNVSNAINTNYDVNNPFKLTVVGTYAFYNGLVKEKTPGLYALFDLDDTLIKTKSGKEFPEDADDWEWFAPNVIDILSDYSKKGYNIVIISNQDGVCKGKVNLIELEIKLRNIYSILSKQDIFITVLMATHNDHYKKPLTGLWNVLADLAGLPVPTITLGQLSMMPHIPLLEDSTCRKPVTYESFFCGDSAGRPKGWLAELANINKIPKPVKKNAEDMSNCDRDFAFNISVRFITPESLFLDYPDYPLFKSPYHELNLVEYVRTYKNYPNLVLQPNLNGRQELIILIGPPASGKSGVAQRYVSMGYELINMEIQKTKNKCLKAAETALSTGKNVVVDGVNQDMESRSPYLRLADKYSTDEKPIEMKAVSMVTPPDLVHHLNNYRVMSSKGKVEFVPILAYRQYHKKYEKPHRDEGFTSVVEIPFIPSFPDQLSEMQFYYHYY